MKRYDIAIVGTGGVSAMNLDGCMAHPERVRLIAACDPDPARLQAACAKYGIPAGYASVDALIDAGGWDAVIVCTPTPVREPVIRALAASGKPILLEKPMADSFAEAERLVGICGTAGVVLAVDQNFRYHYPFHIARRLIAEGRIGKVVSIIHLDLMFRQDAGWRTSCARHALSVMGIHWLDGFRWTLGREATMVTCRTQSSPAIDCAGETDASVQIAFGDETTVTYVESFSTPMGRVETTYVGETGQLTLGYDHIHLYTRDHRRGPVEQWENLYAGSRKPESAFACLNELLTAVDEKREPSNSGRDNLRTVALLDAAYRSAGQSGAPVTLSDGLPG